MSLPIYISLGAGVQSSTLALMASKGLIDNGKMPKAAIFADTQAEPAEVYEWLNWLEKQLVFPVYRVTKGNLAEDELIVRRSKKSGKMYRNQLIPAYVANHGILPRKCTVDYKILPIQRKLRELEKVKRGEKELRVVTWIGISADEADRVKDSRVPWILNRWPLLTGVHPRMTRKMCLDWMTRNGYPEPPRSACYFCPFHSNSEWKRLSLGEFQKAQRFEKKMQEANSKSEVSLGMPFLHPSRQPLQYNILQSIPLKEWASFTNECEGMCGV